jgi:site-specific DNA recombinase
MEQSKPKTRRCAVYTRKSSEEGLEQNFNSLHAQREAFIKSQASEGWKLVKTAYDDGGLSGGTMERPALRRLLPDIGEGLVDVVVVYKVDRLTRSLADFAKMSNCSVRTECRSSPSHNSLTPPPGWAG